MYENLKLYGKTSLYLYKYVCICEYVQFTYRYEITSTDSLINKQKLRYPRVKYIVTEYTVVPALYICMFKNVNEQCR